MRTVPEVLQRALEDASLPIKRRILLYRRTWNLDELKYSLESEAVDITDLLINAGSIKMALDTDEADKWDASNVTLTFNNDLNCFKEGLKGGLFEHSVLWGSKVVYNIEPAENGAPAASITVFTGYIYSSPVFRDNGNQIELTVTSSLDALEYVSAETFCLTKTDEEATEITSSNTKDQGKEFVTLQTGVGYVDTVKYGESLQSASTLSAGNDYDVGDLNEYDQPAKITLQFTPTDGYKMWVSYRHWHEDMKIEDIVNALLDLTENVDKRNIESVHFSNNAVQYEDDLKQKNYNILFDFDEDGILKPSPELPNASVTAGTVEKHCYCRLPSQGYIHVLWDAVNRPDISPYPHPFSPGSNGDEGVLFFKNSNGDGIKVGVYNGNPSCYLKLLLNGEETLLYSANNRQIVGFEFLQEAIAVYSADSSFYGYIRGNVSRTVIQSPTVNIVFSEVLYSLYNRANTAYWDCLLGWRAENLSEEEWTNKTAEQLRNTVLSKGESLRERQIRFNLQLSTSATAWRQLEFQRTSINQGKGAWSFKYSDDGDSWSDAMPTDNGSSLADTHKYLRLYYKSPGNFAQSELFEDVKISSFVTSTPIPLVNLTDLTVGEAIGQLAKMACYEIGFNQEGEFFFRARKGQATAEQISPSDIVGIDNHCADIDGLFNRVSVEYGKFKTVVDDFTEKKPRPNTIDTYGVHVKSFSDDNFIPADNVDISRAVAKANYDALCTPGYTLQVDCVPNLGLELGDKITVSSQNQEMANPNWSDYHKFLQLPVWKRLFKVQGIEFDLDKRLMTLSLKDMTTADDTPPMEYIGYQTQFPIPLNYKE